MPGMWPALSYYLLVHLNFIYTSLMDSDCTYPIGEAPLLYDLPLVSGFHPILKDLLKDRQNGGG